MKKIVVTSSIASLAAFDASWQEKTYGDKGEYFNLILSSLRKLVLPVYTHGILYHSLGTDWNPQTYEDAVKPGLHPIAVYFASKKLSDEAVHRFAKEHPEISISTGALFRSSKYMLQRTDTRFILVLVHPHFIYGPTSRGQILDVPAEGTNNFIYSLFQSKPGTPRGILPPAQQGVPPACIHIYDVARAHVMLLSPPTSAPLSLPGEVKRVVLKSETMHWKDAVEYLAATRPELKDRLVIVPDDYEIPKGWARTSGESAERWLGIKDGDYKGWKEMLDGAVDDILRREKSLGL